MSLLRALAGRLRTRPRPIPVTQVKEHLKAGAYLLDVRTRPESRQARWARARKIPLDELADRLSDIPTGRPVLVMCQRGGRSARGAALLRRCGYQVLAGRGGLGAWQQAGLPVEAGDRGRRR